jgi:hypothetical protein
MSGLPLRKFGFMFGVVFALLAAWLRATPWAVAVFGLLSMAMLAAALLRPTLLAGPTRLWLRLGEVLHHVVSPIVLGALYALLIVPTGLLRRWLGGDPLKRGYDASAPTYWTPCEPRKRSLDDFRQQF